MNPTSKIVRVTGRCLSPPGHFNNLGETNSIFNCPPIHEDTTCTCRLGTGPGCRHGEERSVGDLVPRGDNMAPLHHRHHHLPCLSCTPQHIGVKAAMVTYFFATNIMLMRIQNFYDAFPDPA